MEIENDWGPLVLLMQCYLIFKHVLDATMEMSKMCSKADLKHYLFWWGFSPPTLMDSNTALHYSLIKPPLRDCSTATEAFIFCSTLSLFVQNSWSKVLICWSSKQYRGDVCLFANLILSCSRNRIYSAAVNRPLSPFLNGDGRKQGTFSFNGDCVLIRKCVVQGHWHKDQHLPLTSDNTNMLTRLKGNIMFLLCSYRETIPKKKAHDYSCLCIEQCFCETQLIHTVQAPFSLCRDICEEQ